MVKFDVRCPVISNAAIFLKNPSNVSKLGKQKANDKKIILSYSKISETSIFEKFM